MEKKELAKTILFALALAMGIAVIVMSYLGKPPGEMGMPIGIAILCLAIVGFISIDTEKF